MAWIKLPIDAQWIVGHDYRLTFRTSAPFVGGDRYASLMAQVRKNLLTDPRYFLTGLETIVTRNEFDFPEVGIKIEVHALKEGSAIGVIVAGIIFLIVAATAWGISLDKLEKAEGGKALVGIAKALPWYMLLAGGAALLVAVGGLKGK